MNTWKKSACVIFDRLQQRTTSRNMQSVFFCRVNGVWSVSHVSQRTMKRNGNLVERPAFCYRISFHSRGLQQLTVPPFLSRHLFYNPKEEHFFLSSQIYLSYHISGFVYRNPRSTWSWFCIIAHAHQYVVFFQKEMNGWTTCLQIYSFVIDWVKSPLLTLSLLKASNSEHSDFYCYSIKITSWSQNNAQTSS